MHARASAIHGEGKHALERPRIEFHRRAISVEIRARKSGHEHRRAQIAGRAEQLLHKGIFRSPQRGCVEPAFFNKTWRIESARVRRSKDEGYPLLLWAQ